MRTTLTLDEDVARQLEALKDERRVPMRQLVNDALRAGLAVLVAPLAEKTTYRTEPVQGEPRFANIDDIAEVLAVAEGEDHS